MTQINDTKGPPPPRNRQSGYGSQNIKQPPHLALVSEYTNTKYTCGCYGKCA